MAVVGVLAFAQLATTIGQEAPKRAVRFETRTVHVDPQGSALAAYQFSVLDPSESATLVGIEGGTHPAFSQPPYYDPEALRSGRAIVAAYSLAEDLPVRSTHVATLHWMVESDGELELVTTLITASDANGNRVGARVFSTNPSRTAPPAEETSQRAAQEPKE